MKGGGTWDRGGVLLSSGHTVAVSRRRLVDDRLGEVASGDHRGVRTLWARVAVKWPWAMQVRGLGSRDEWRWSGSMVTRTHGLRAVASQASILTQIGREQTGDTVSPVLASSPQGSS